MRIHSGRLEISGTLGLVRAQGLRAIVLVLAACEASDPPPEPERCPIGDLAKAPEIEIVFRDEAGSVHSATPGGDIPLIQPPQGGKVLFVAVRAQNVDGCALKISASLRDPCSGTLVSLERRPINLVATAGGYGEPARPDTIDNFSNLPACPRAGTSKDVVGQRHLLRVTVEDRAGKTAEASVEVVPRCAESTRVLCECECRSDYVLGESCGERPDAGTASECVDGG